LKKFALLNNANIKGFTKAAIKRLESLNWKGNVRELENAIERAVVLANSEFVDVDDLPGMDQGFGESKPEEGPSGPALFSVNSIMTLEDMNKKIYRIYF